MHENKFKLITVESDFGAGKKGAALGPMALIEELKKIQFNAININQPTRLTPQIVEPSTETPFGKNIETITKFQEITCTEIVNTLQNNQIPFILSGDHSNANALISGVKDFYPNQRIGVIWIDAHADLHSPYTTPSGNIHGMPLAALMGQDHREIGANQPKEITKTLWNQLKRLGRKNISPKIQGKDLVFIALRSTETQEENIITKEAIAAFTPNHIREFGIETIASKTTEHLKNCDKIYVSFDVDSLDSNLSVGTGTPVADGLSLEQAAYLLKTFIKLPQLAGFEITEINPELDTNKPMAPLIAKLMQAIFN